MAIVLDSPHQFDTATLRAAIDGRVERLAPGPALTLLVGKGYSGAAKVLEDLLTEPGREDRLRARAATLLARACGERSTGALLAALQDPAPIIRLEAVKSLGRVAGAEALTPVQRLACTAEGRLARQAQFAAVLIAARAGLPEPRADFGLHRKPLPFAGPCAEPASIRSAAREEFDEAITALADDPLGIDFDETTSLKISGAGLTWILLLNCRCAALLAQPEANVLLGAIAEWDGSDDRWYLNHSLIAGPADSSIVRPLGAFDDAGEVGMYGWLKRQGDCATFELSTVSPFALPLQAAGHVSGRKVLIDRLAYVRANTGRRIAPLLAGG